MSVRLVLVADGARAKLLCKNGVSLEQIGDEYLSLEAKDGVDMEISKPGRCNSGSSSSHTYSPHTDLHEGVKKSFAREMAGMVNNSCVDFDGFVMIAPPAILGELRKHLSPIALDKLEHEVPKDLTKAKIADLEKYLTVPYK